jgi:hypothetical protein
MAINPEELDPAIRNALMGAVSRGEYSTSTPAVPSGASSNEAMRIENASMGAVSRGEYATSAPQQSARDPQQEALAIKNGVSREYIESRGGINAAGYYNDVPLYKQLTLDELASVTLPGGNIDTQAQANILLKKEYDYLISTGLPVDMVVSRLQSSYGYLYNSSVLPQEAQRVTPITGGGSTAMGGTTTGGTTTGGTTTGGTTPGGTTPTTPGKTVVSTYTDPTTGDIVAIYTDGTTQVMSRGAVVDQQTQARQSAYDLLYQQFSNYGLGSLVEPLKNLISEGISPSEFTLRLRETDAYKKRFAANAQRVAQGLRALSEGEYIALEDQYQNIMRNYGLPASYYSRGDLGVQQGFEKFIANDVSAAELEDRIQTAQNRVINAAPEISATLRNFYPNISDGDILAYVLDPSQAITEIKRKVQAAEIGGAAAMSGLGTGVTRAEELARYGVTGEQARQGYQAVANILPRGTQLSEFYKQTPYTQTTAEQEVFGITGATEAEKQRKKLTQLEQASFSGQAGIAGSALSRERAGSF